VVEATCP